MEAGQKPPRGGLGYIRIITVIRFINTRPLQRASRVRRRRPSPVKRCPPPPPILLPLLLLFLLLLLPPADHGNGRVHRIFVLFCTTALHWLLYRPPSAIVHPIPARMNIHVLLTDYSLLLFAGDAAAIAETISTKIPREIICFATIHAVESLCSTLLKLLLPQAAASRPVQLCPSCSSASSCGTRGWCTAFCALFTASYLSLVIGQVNIVLDEVSSKRRLRLERYRHRALSSRVLCMRCSFSRSLEQGTAAAAGGFRVSRGPQQVCHWHARHWHAPPADAAWSQERRRLQSSR